MIYFSVGWVSTQELLVFNEQILLSRELTCSLLDQNLIIGKILSWSFECLENLI